MRTLITRLAACAATLAALAGAAQAEVLVSADNSAVQTVLSPSGNFALLDGTHNSLGFSTTKAHEVLQLSFGASVCGVSQIKPQYTSALTKSAVNAMIYVDFHAVHATPVPLCSYTIAPVGAGFQTSGKGKLQYRVVVPTPGSHTIQVSVSYVVTSNSNSMYPLFGQTHVMVSH